MLQHLVITMIISLSYVALAFSDRQSNGEYVIKTILTEDGDLFNCIDINQQPTFSHQLLKNHKIQMNPSSYPFELHNRSSSGATKFLAQLPTISCPRGTIPILQNSKGGIINFQCFRAKNVERKGELAIAKTVDNIYGSSVSINVYEPKVKEKSEDFSASWLTLLNDGNLLGAGSMVWQNFSGDNFARFHILWEQQSHLGEWCFDHRCPGFVQVSSSIGLGAKIQPVSVYNGPQHQIDVLVFKDPKTKDWWLAFGGKPVGYWPSSFFSGMDKIAQAAWGGYVWGPTARLNFPEMGSGHFAQEGFGKAAFMKDIKIVNENNKYVTPNMDKTIAASSKRSCYSVDNLGHDDGGMHVFYGGPGGCKT